MKSYPASEIQKVMLKYPAWPITETFHAVGELSREALDRAVGALFARHDLLRTSFRFEGDRVWQDVQDADRRPELVYTDLGHLSEAEQIVAVRDTVEGGVQSLKPEVPPLMRAFLFRLGPKEHVVNIVLDHLITDPTSSTLVGRELVRLYDAFVRSEPPELPPVTLTYGELSQREFELLATKRGEMVQLWRDTLRRMVQPTAVPTDHPRTGEAGPKLNVIVEIPPDVVTRLGRAARVMHSSFGLLAAGTYFLFLHDATGDPRVMAPFNVSLRSSRLSNVLGPMHRFFPLEVEFKPGMLGTDLGAQVRDGYSLALRAKEITMPTLIMEANEGRPLQHRTSINVMVLGPTRVTVEGGGVKFTPTPRFKKERPLLGQNELAGIIALHPEPTPSTLRFTYDSKLFERSSVERLIQRWLTLMDRITRNPTAPIHELLANGA